MGTVLLHLLAVAALCGLVESQVPNIIASYSALMGDEWQSGHQPIHDDEYAPTVYDFIIVGGGTAGCVLANRLTEVTEWEVLLLEAGEEETAIMSVPYFTGLFEDSDTNWNYKSVPSIAYCTGLTGRQCDYGSGKVLGGNSAVNYMLNIRGNKYDYDNWESMGNLGWGYDNVLPYFNKVENMLIPDLRDNEYHSTTGNIKISYPAYRSEISSIFVEAGREVGEAEVDYNGDIQRGFSRLQTTTANGTRWSASKGYLYPIRYRTNLYIKMKSLVTKILISDTSRTAYGVEYIRDGKTFRALARKEVVLSAGAINSPQLLMLSGIGPWEHLRDLNIPLIQDLPVGHNLMDHVTFIGLVFTVNASKALNPFQILGDPANYLNYMLQRTGPLTLPSSLETVSYLEVPGVSCYSVGWPNIETVYSSTVTSSLLTSVLNDELYNEFFKPIENTYAFQAFVKKIRPDSRGTVTLADGNIHTQPIIDPKFFSTEGDVVTVIAGIQRALELIQTEPLRAIGTQLYEVPVPKCRHHAFASDDYWRCAMRQLSMSTHHPCGTCKMGPAYDLSAVVSPQLKVHGVGDLRVVDASIMPQIVSGHLCTPVYMLAEKGADLIKEAYGYL